MDPLSLKRWNIVTGFIVISCIKMDQIKISLQLETAYPGLSPALSPHLPCLVCLRKAAEQLSVMDYALAFLVMGCVLLMHLFCI